ncbi:MAG: hypothetical protein R2862_09380 [Thermoanaerobaculia bacterium]
MSRSTLPLTYTDIELRSYLPSGWGILAGAAGLWDRSAGTWKIDVYDSADNVWSSPSRAAMQTAPVASRRSSRASTSSTARRSPDPSRRQAQDAGMGRLPA